MENFKSNPTNTNNLIYIMIFFIKKIPPPPIQNPYSRPCACTQVCCVKSSRNPLEGRETWESLIKDIKRTEKWLSSLTSEKGIATIITNTGRGVSSSFKGGGDPAFWKEGIKLLIKLGCWGVPSKNCEWECGCGDFFKELTLRVSILNAQNSKLLLKYAKILPQ